MPNMLTTLGVFIAIVIAVVACYLSLILSEPFNGKELKYRHTRCHRPTPQ